MISCKEATKLMEQDLAQKLTFKDRVNLKIHRLLCKACNQYGIQSKWVDSVLKNLTTNQALSVKEKRAMQEKLKGGN